MAVTQNIGKFLLDILNQGVYQPIERFGKFGLEASAQGVRQVVDPRYRGSQINQIDKISQGQTRKSKELIELAKQATDPALKKSLLDQSRNLDAQTQAQVISRTPDRKQPAAFLLNESDIANRGQILKTGSKATAGAGALAIPGGGAGANFATKSGLSALSGLLAGYGSSKEGEELISSVGGAIIGGLTPAAFSGLGKVGDYLFGNKLPTISGSKIKTDPGFSKTIKKMQTIANEIGINDKMKSTQKMEVVDSAFSKFQGEIDSILEKSKPVTKDVINEKLALNYNNSGVDPNAKVTKTALKLLGEAANTDNPNIALNKLKATARKNMGNIFRKGGENPTPKQEAWGMVYNTIKDSLDTVSAKVRKINSKQQVLFDLADEFGGAAKKSTDKVKINPTFGLTNLSIPTSITTEGANRFAGQVGRALASPVSLPAKAVTSAAKNTPDSLRQLLSPIIANLGMGGGTSQPTTTQPATTQSTTTPTGSDPLSQLVASGVPEAQAQAFVAAMTGNQPAASRTGEITPEMASLAQLMLPSSEASKIQKAYDIQEKSKKAQIPTAKIQENASKLDQLEKNITLLEPTLSEIPTGLGAIAPLLGSNVPFTDLGSNVRVYKQFKQAFTGPMARVISAEVGVLTDKDVERADLLPKITDGEETRKMKLQLIKQAIDNLRNGKAMSPEGQAMFNQGAYQTNSQDDVLSAIQSLSLGL